MNTVFNEVQTKESNREHVSHNKRILYKYSEIDFDQTLFVSKLVYNKASFYKPNSV